MYACALSVYVIYERIKYQLSRSVLSFCGFEFDVAPRAIVQVIDICLLLALTKSFSGNDKHLIIQTY